MPVKLLKNIKHYRIQRIIPSFAKFLIKKEQRQPGYSKRAKKSQPVDWGGEVRGRHRDHADTAVSGAEQTCHHCPWVCLSCRG